VEACTVTVAREIVDEPSRKVIFICCWMPRVSEIFHIFLFIGVLLLFSRCVVLDRTEQ